MIDDPLHAAGDQQIGSLFQTGTAKFQEGGFDVGVAAGACEVGGRRPDGLVGRFDSGAVGEDDDSSSHALLMYCAHVVDLFGLLGQLEIHQIAHGEEGHHHDRRG